MPRTDYKLRPDSSKSFIKQAIDDYTIEPVFAFAHRSIPGIGQGGKGELHLGAINTEYTLPDLEYHDCVPDSPFWMIDKATITVGNYKVENIRTIFDTASRLVRGPKEEVSKIYASIEEIWPSKENENGIYDAIHRNQEAPEVTFQWGASKTQWKIPREK